MALLELKDLTELLVSPEALEHLANPDSTEVLEPPVTLANPDQLDQLAHLVTLANQD